MTTAIGICSKRVSLGHQTSRRSELSTGGIRYAKFRPRRLIDANQCVCSNKCHGFWWPQTSFILGEKEKVMCEEEVLTSRPRYSQSIPGPSERQVSVVAGHLHLIPVACLQTVYSLGYNIGWWFTDTGIKIRRYDDNNKIIFWRVNHKAMWMLAQDLLLSVIVAIQQWRSAQYQIQTIIDYYYFTESDRDFRAKQTKIHSFPVETNVNY